MNNAMTAIRSILMVVMTARYLAKSHAQVAQRKDASHVQSDGT